MIIMEGGIVIGLTGWKFWIIFLNRCYNSLWLDIGLSCRKLYKFGNYRIGKRDH